ncbi:SpoIID/LytB domain-containing protein [Paenibacillus daejeonensis]|uniref:SpoIID/LytB domain-containing protein n=1 Tax=Paenibacillus daejeonensis TaxID=135193 RepID=UPI00036B4CC5|nr:SpoIID/LytB domain-containing protein [Paenibacillus daejeonensis]
MSKGVRDMKGRGSDQHWPHNIFQTISGLLVLSMTVALIGIWPTAVAAEQSSIRVGLFFNLPGKYTTTTPVATLSGSQGLQVGIRQPSGEVRYGAHSGAARFTLNDYKVTILQTSDFAAAQAAYKRVRESTPAVWLTSSPGGTGRLYEVTEGSYPTLAEARTSVERWSRGGYPQAALSGPLQLESTPYDTLAKARATQAAIGDKGLSSDIGVRPAASGAMEYVVLTGRATDAAALEQVRTQAGMDALKAAAQSAMLVLREDHSLTGTAGNSDGLYLLNAATTAWVSDASGQGIQLTERSARTYRGGFELSRFNNRLAVINEVPLDQYLYAVVPAEMPASWPAEALKAQAVAARTYALYNGTRFEIADVVDSVLSQVYRGISDELPATNQAVDATSGEVAKYNGRLIETLFSSSSGGATANAEEVWGNQVPYLVSVTSPDEASEAGLYSWYRVALADGRNGYIREDILEPVSERTAAGSAMMRVKEEQTNMRPIPLIQEGVAPVARLSKGTLVTVLEKTVQSNSNTWVRGPFTSSELVASMQGKLMTPFTGPIRTLEVSQYGPSQRATELQANGARLDIRYPDTFRSALGGLPSTRFVIDETARVTIQGAGGAKTEKPSDSSAVAVLGANGQVSTLDEVNYYAMDGTGTLRAITKEPFFRFVGRGNGHGVGLSQWGARGLAEQGYDYKRILQYYYTNVTIGKE